MSCSSVDISGSGPVTTTTPAGPPLLVANLDPMKQECYTKEGTSVIYPQKYVVGAPVYRAAVALGLEPFPGPDPDACGSDSLTFVNC